MNEPKLTTLHILMYSEDMPMLRQAAQATGCKPEELIQGIVGVWLHSYAKKHPPYSEYQTIDVQSGP